MQGSKYRTLIYAIEELKKQGYTNEFKIKNKKLLDLKTRKSYLPDQMTIVEQHRFEGMSNPSDMSILFALETEDGEKGTVVSSYGPYADINLFEFLNQVEVDTLPTQQFFI